MSAFLSTLPYDRPLLSAIAFERFFTRCAGQPGGTFQPACSCSARDSMCPVLFMLCLYCKLTVLNGKLYKRFSM